MQRAGSLRYRGLRAPARCAIRPARGTWLALTETGWKTSSSLVQGWGAVHTGRRLKLAVVRKSRAGQIRLLPDAIIVWSLMVAPRSLVVRPQSGVPPVNHKRKETTVQKCIVKWFNPMKG